MIVNNTCIEHNVRLVKHTFNYVTTKGETAIGTINICPVCGLSNDRLKDTNNKHIR